MTKERLQGLSFASLLDIATKEGISVSENLDKESLIEVIREAMEEDRNEREQSNNSAMRIKEKKYDITRDEELESGDSEEYELPERYNETRIVAMLRDPLWAFAYWDLKDSELEKGEVDADTMDLFLRVCEMKSGEDVESGVVDYFDIPVSSSDSSWYINLPAPGKSYVIELHAGTAEAGRLLCRSNAIHSPLGQVAVEYLHEMITHPDNDSMVLTGLDQYSGSSLRENIPQRIISMIDSEYLQMKS
ncbi:MAG TPA: DUF4912 domain-containing protein [Spirochaetia bacterium]|nr:DUF4912 domain-containing protein [Spirochaetia bacterium]